MSDEILSSEDLRQKIAAFREKNGVDLSQEEDLSIAVMNLVSLEEHFYFTAEKTGKDEYFDLLTKVREVRKKMLGKMIDSHEGETWCISKHLLAATMRLVEVGTKLHGDGKIAPAKEMFDNAYEIYSLFWALRLKLVDLGKVKAVGDGQLNIHDKSDPKQPWTFKTVLSKLLDCCRE